MRRRRNKLIREKLYRWSVLENFIFLSQVFVEFENRRDIAAAGKSNRGLAIAWQRASDINSDFFFPPFAYNGELDKTGTYR